MTEISQQHIAIVGALAYDQICTTTSSLTSSNTPLLNRKLTDIVEAFGGCGGNIAFNLGLLNQPALLLSCSGTLDDNRYITQLNNLGIDTSYCLRMDDHYTARAVIFTDLEGKQFTGFYPGPIPQREVWQQHLHSIDFNATRLFIQAPYPPGLMQASLTHISAFAQPPLRIFAPGQYADQLDGGEIASLVQLTDWIVGNEHEINCLEQHQPLERKFIIRTDGAGPVELRLSDGSREQIDVPVVLQPVDPTGCGDAFLAGLACHLIDAADRSSSDVASLMRTPDQTALPLLRDAVIQGCRAARACLSSNGAQQHSL